LKSSQIHAVAGGVADGVALGVTVGVGVATAWATADPTVMLSVKIKREPTTERRIVVQGGHSDCNDERQISLKMRLQDIG
jgi:hypothetical protein